MNEVRAPKLGAAAAPHASAPASAPRGEANRWAHPALAAIIAVAGVVYAIGIRLGLVHDYYSPAVYSMSKSWKAYLWGSFDGTSITIDKLPGEMWIQALVVRAFGFNDWSVLMPQVIESLIAIAVVFFTARRWVTAFERRTTAGATATEATETEETTGSAPKRPTSAAANLAGLLAALGLATTPIVAALSHGEISDTLLTLMLCLAAYAWTRAMDKGSWKWLALTGFFVGWAFNAKMAEAWGILPAFALTYLAFAPGGFGRRVWHTLVAGVTTAVFSLWWLVLVTLTPADSRPWIDGSTDNSAWSMVFKYNLSGRYEGTSDRVGGWSYIFGADVATQAGWFYLTALVGLVALLWYTRKAPRTDLMRAAAVMAGIWFAVFFIAFSKGQVAHSYYVIVLGPPLAWLTAVGAVVAWRRNRAWIAVMALAAVGWAVYLSSHYTSFYAFSIPVIIVLAVVGLIALAASRRLRFAAPIAAVTLALSGLVTPAVWAASTTQSGYSGSVIGPSAGPARGMGGPGGNGENRDGGQPSQDGGQPGMMPGGAPTGEAPQGAPASGQMQMPTDGAQSGSAEQTAADGQMMAPPSGNAPQMGEMPQGAPTDGSTNGTTTDGQQKMGMGGPGGMQGTDVDGATLLDYIRSNNPGGTYDVVAIGYHSASSFITSGGKVISVGGFSGGMNNLSLDKLKELINNGEVHYVYTSGAGRGPGGGGGMGGLTTDTATDSSTEITNWVQANCQVASDSGSSNLYVCTAAS
ncbi:glycosyltransferase family 39 protein [Corynebacterium vitaeruminis]|uniref:Putative Glycosyl transferase n=1 Tax=Corynebacterium vitaeruminis DSM 20294 TaxID=1224164 RepID=W5XXQ0_9CORY|nr:glycosyltransferase family 39 protein [Corynebacterium vitaeruminis]AHI21816.1 putative Glycosyl transferase [Corynebacterium vitaeruminis DSM 20294]